LILSLIHCSVQQPEPPEQQTEELPTVQPDVVVYAHIEHEPGLRNNTNAPANNHPVLYSELLSKDNNAFIRGPSGDLYAEVQKR